MPMAAVIAEMTCSTPGEERPYYEVSKGYTPFLDGDLLVAKITPCFENGKITQARIQYKFGFGSTEFHVVRPYRHLVDARYLLHFLRQEKVRLEGERKMTGSAGQRRVPVSFLANLEIPLPPLAEQQRIAAILDRADELRAKRRAALAQLDTLTQSIFIDMFGDPTTNPNEWPNSTILGEVAEITSGVTKGRKLNGKEIRSIPYLAVVNVQDRRLDLSTIKTIDATEEEIQRYRLIKDDLLLTEGGDPDKLGRGTLWNDELPECIHQNHIFRVRLRSDVLHPLFLNWLMSSHYGKRYFLRAAKQTTGIATINMTQLRNFPLLLPPIEIQQRFAACVAAVGELACKHRASLAELNALFASLQHRAFRGEL
ncbi:MAG: restriction endonuclease subunit S [Caldilineaceae bacterium]|nr:restriction endonuclease subunit S [Caldilineaceae bacterium]